MAGDRDPRLSSRLQRLVELRLADRQHASACWPRARVEIGAGHYPLIVAVHAAWLAALWWFAPGRPINSPSARPLRPASSSAASGCSRRSGRAGRRGSSSCPGATLVRRGPYRFVDHPNYLVVIAEIAVLPLVFGLWQIALDFQPAERGRPHRPHPRREPRSGAACAAKSFAPISHSSPRHRQMPEAGAPRLRSQELFGLPRRQSDRRIA